MSERLEADADFRFIPVACTPGLDGDYDQLKLAAELYYREHGFDLPTHFDPRGVTRMTLMRDLQLEDFVYPTTVLLDRKGAIQAVWVGYKAGLEEEMEKEVKKLLR